MSTPSKAPGATKPTYISSSGQTLDHLPITARLNRAADSIYNFVGLYLTSLLSLDPYSAAQNSRFNTRGPGRPVTTSTSAGGAARPGSTRLGGGGGGGGGASSGPRGGGGGAGGPGRRIGTVDDVRGPECGSCG